MTEIIKINDKYYIRRKPNVFNLPIFSQLSIPRYLDNGMDIYSETFKHWWTDSNTLKGAFSTLEEAETKWKRYKKQLEKPKIEVIKTL